MRKIHRALSVICLFVTMNGCTVLNRDDRLRIIKSPSGDVAVNVTTATRRLAIVFPTGRTCSELGPPAILQGKKDLGVDAGAGQTAAGEAKVGVKLGQDLTAVSLQTSTERIECLRFALFHACNAAATGTPRLTYEQEKELLSEAITGCGNWSVRPQSVNDAGGATSGEVKP